MRTKTKRLTLKYYHDFDEVFQTKKLFVFVTIIPESMKIVV